MEENNIQPLSEEELINCIKTLEKVVNRKQPNSLEETDITTETYIGLISLLCEIVSVRNSMKTKNYDLSEQPDGIDKTNIQYETEDDISKLRRVFKGYNFEE